MNEYDIDRAAERFASHPVLGSATKFLVQYRDQVNQHSDGWAYWGPPVKAASKLFTLIENPDTATIARLRAAIAPIKGFYTRRGNAAGMEFPKDQ